MIIDWQSSAYGRLKNYYVLAFIREYPGPAWEEPSVPEQELVLVTGTIPQLVAVSGVLTQLVLVTGAITQLVAVSGALTQLVTVGGVFTQTVTISGELLEED